MVTRIAALLWEPDRWVRAPAAEALGRLGPLAVRAEVVERLESLLQDKEEVVRTSAAIALARMMSSGVRWFRAGYGGVQVQWTWELAT
jgi:HEAT repeat protein